jgi:SAM-dependent methyltransferase
VGLLAGARRRARDRGGNGSQPVLLPWRRPPHGHRVEPRDAGDREGRQAELGRAADLRLGDAQRLEFGDESFDTVVSTLSLCTIPDHAEAVREAYRVLRPDGRFLLLEHVRSAHLAVRLVQRMLDPLAVRFAADHLVREPLDQLVVAGFEIERLERSKWGIVERIAARKPRDNRGDVEPRS